MLSRAPTEGGAKCGALQRETGAQKAAQHPVARKRTRRSKHKKARKTRAEVQTCAIACDYCTRLTQYPVGESNPCLRRERALSWATRRTGRRRLDAAESVILEGRGVRG